MIKPLPVDSSFARLIFLPGESSVKTSRSGILSPTWTRADGEAWKLARGGHIVPTSRGSALKLANL